MNWLQWLFPKKCVGCGEWGEYLCADCLNRLSLARNQVCPGCNRPSMLGIAHEKCLRSGGMDGLIATLNYKGLAKMLVTKMKYKLVSDLVNEVVELVVSFSDWEVLQGQEWVVVPVPLYRSRERWRGFNQAEEIGKELGQRMGFEVGSNWLRRIRNTKVQAGLNKIERRENVRGAFAIGTDGRKAGGAKVLLVDDVWTTGATMRECAKVLRRAGAEKVWGLVVAKA